MFRKFLVLTTALFMGVIVLVNSPTAIQASPNESQTSPDEEQAPLVYNADAFFDDSYVHEIQITFTDSDWYNTLYDSHANDPDDPYFPASFEADGVTLDPIGVRFKGNSSFTIPGVKKSFKFDFDEYDEGNPAINFFGLTKLNLNNSFKDPSLLREKLFLDFASQFVPVPRAVHTKLYVNGTYWGLYTAVEQIDKTFNQDRFGDGEDGNLFKADPVSGEFGSDLTWLGTNPADYEAYYQLKTNETANDYSQLIEFINVLNNTSPQDFPTNLEPIFDVDGALAGLALNSLFVNLDSYTGSAHNYYLYDRDDNGRFTHIHWDTNESFGRFLQFMPPWENPMQLSAFWLPDPPPQQPDEERPLMENLWANADYNNDYLCHIDAMLDAGFDSATMSARITELANLIRADVYADNNKQYTNAEFETNLTSSVQDGNSTIYGLLDFTQQRASALENELAAYTLDCAAPLDGTLFINEFMADNDTVLEDPDEPGEYPDWIELYNASATDVDLQNLYLTDDLTDPTQYQITDTLTVPAGGFILLYADSDPEQGAAHTNFKLGAGGEEIALFEADGLTLIDSYTYGAQTTDQSEGRCPDGDAAWLFFPGSTPGATNGACNAPVISNVDHTPSTPLAADTVTVTATITDDVAIITATLWYSAGVGYTAVPMTDQGANLYAAAIPAHPDDTTVAYYLEAVDDAGLSVTAPANAPANFYSYQVGYQPPPLYINEFMASNATVLEDPDDPGDFPDWIEIYNAGTNDIDMQGLYLTDDLADPTQYQITGTLMVPAGSFVILYADSDTEQGVAHTNFKLGAGGEDVALVGADGTTVVDGYTFGAQTTDQSEGRCPDGAGAWTFFASSTPGASNTCYQLYLSAALASADSALLDWNDTSHDSYELWRSESAYSAYAQYQVLAVSDYLEMDGVDNTAVNYFYEVYGVSGGAAAEVSNRIGIFTFEITPGS